MAHAKMAEKLVLLATFWIGVQIGAVIPPSTTTMTLTTQGQKSACPHRWLSWPGGDSCYRLWPESSKNWETARRTCQLYGADLLKLDSTQEKEWIMEQIVRFSPDNEWWIGLRRNETDEQAWLWTDGTRRNESNAYIPWGSNEPNNYRGEEDCAEIWDNLLNDKNCAQLLQFICERSSNIPLLCNVDDGWDNHGSDNCFKFFDDKLTWRDARKRCYKDDADLLSIEGQQDQHIITDYIRHENKSATWLKLAFQLTRDPANTQSNETYKWSWDTEGSTSLSSADQWWNTEPPGKDTLLYNKTLCSIMDSNATDYRNWWISSCEDKNKFMCMKTQGKCPEGFRKHADNCLGVFVTERLNWNEARGFCNLRGTTMLEINSEARQDFVTAMLKSMTDTVDIWIALSGSTPAWAWDSKKPLGSYEQKQLDGTNGSGCIYIKANDEGQWYVGDCSQQKAVMCTVPENHPIITLPPTRQSIYVCPENYNGPFEDQCYRAIYEDLDWVSARQTCIEQGADLAVISSLTQLGSALSVIQKDVWIGLNDRLEEGKHVWLDSKLQPTTLWNTVGQNLNVVIGGKYSENCVVMQYRPGNEQNGKWIDIPCNLKRNFLCQVKGERNIAQGKFASLSSNTQDAWLAIDGCISNCNCSTTKKSDKPWLRLDLGTYYPVSKIALYPEENALCIIDPHGCGIKSFDVYVTNSTSTQPEVTEQVRYTKDMVIPEKLLIMLSDVTYGRYLQIESVDTNFSLSICELQVFEVDEASISERTKDTSESDSSDCTGDWHEDSFSGICYNTVNQTLTWADADNMCSFLGGTLAVPVDPSHISLPKDVLSGSFQTEFWIGASVSSGLKDWQTKLPADKLADKMNAVSSRTSDSSKTLCGLIKNGELAASECLERKPFACQKFSTVVKFKTSQPSNEKSLQSSHSKVMMDNSSLKFSIRGNKGAQIMLVTAKNYTVKVVLCAVTNKKSYILENETRVKTAWVENLCNETEYVQFYISWQAGTMKVGKGSKVGNNVFMEWTGRGLAEEVFTKTLQVFVSSVTNNDIYWTFARDLSDQGTPNTVKAGSVPRIDAVNELNVAYQKETLSSGTYLSFIKSSSAVDGCIYTTFVSRCCMHTQYGREPWWKVDLGKVYSVKEVYIYKRTDCCPQRLAGFQMTFLIPDSRGNDIGEVVYRHSGTVQDVTIIPTPGKRARKVEISLPGRTDFLELCEVMVIQDKCRDGWQVYEDGDEARCVDVSDMRLSWIHARDFCHDHNATLGLPKSPEEQLFLFNLLFGKKADGADPSIWMGLHDNSKEGQFETVDGSPLGYTDWAPGEPNNLNGENCGAFRADVDQTAGQWNDFNCDKELRFYCQKKEKTTTTQTTKPMTTTVTTTPVPIEPTATMGYGNGKCKEGWTYNNRNKACYKIFRNYLTFFDAMRICLQDHARLSSIENEAEREFLIKLVKNDGIVQQASTWSQVSVAGYESNEGTWAWYLYDTHWWTGIKWSRGQPDDYNKNEDCTGFRVGQDNVGELNDYDCHNKGLMGFICKDVIDGYKCQEGWNYDFRTKTCYKTFNTKLTWDAANSDCMSKGATLTSVGSSVEQEFINAILTTSDAYWVGGYFAQGADWFQWIDKTTWWAFVEFDTGSGRDIKFGNSKICVAFINGKLRVSICDQNLPYICKMKAMDTTQTTSSTVTMGTKTTSLQPTPVGVSVGPTTPGNPQTSRSSPQKNTTDELCGKGWESNRDLNSCYKFITDPATWYQASAYCQEDAANLASIVTPAEQLYLTGRLFGQPKLASSDLWIGANNHDMTSGWKWTDGSAFAYFSWQPLQPDDADSKGCGALVTTNSRFFGKWKGSPCEDKKGYICKKVIDQRQVTAVTPMATLSGEYYGCPGNGWVGYGHSCYLMVQEKQEWQEARSKCRQEGADLASILDENEQNFVFSQLPQDSYCFNIWRNNTQCTIWAERGECDHNPTWMATHCHLACQYCHHNCRDKYLSSSKCTQWALEGECDKNPRWMLHNCAMSCGVCVGAPTRGFWMGLIRKDHSPVYSWTDHSAVTFTDWALQQPIGFQKKGQRCGAMYLQTGKWNDGECEMTLPGYVCKQPMKVLPKTTQSPYKEGCTGANSYGYGAFCYTYVQEEKIWEEAQQACNRTGGSLANIPDIYVQSFVASELANLLQSHWIGLTIRNHTMTWTSMKDVGFTHFEKKFDGLSHTAETCFAMKSRKPVGVWLPFDCDIPLPFVCQNPREGYTTVTTTPLPTTNVPCPEPWIEFNNNCYWFSEDEDAKPWKQAEKQCGLYGASLTSINSKEESDYLKYLITFRSSSVDRFWIGLNDRDEEGTFVWTDGSPFIYEKWAKDEPNDINGEDCSEILGSGFWNDMPCSRAQPFICKTPKGKQVEKFGQTPTVAFEVCDGNLDFMSIEDKCFYFEGEQYKSWHEASKACNARGAHLASIHTLQEQEALHELVSHHLTWIGYTRLGFENTYHWSDGSPVDFTYWDSSQPNDDEAGEKCALISNGRWHDYNCNDEMSYLCMKLKGGSTLPPTTTPALHITGGCPLEFVGFGNRCYFLFPKDELGMYITWSFAKSECLRRKSELVSIHSELEQAFLTTQVKDLAGGLWVGLSDTSGYGHFSWVDNTQLLYTNWDDAEPSNEYYLSDTCIEMYAKASKAGLWNDLNCDSNRGYICATYKRTQYTSKEEPYQEQGDCPEGYIKFADNCYKPLQQKANWANGQAACGADNATLPRVRSFYEQAFLQVLVTSSETELWTDGKNQKENGVRWSNGEVPQSPVKYRSRGYSGADNICISSMGNEWQTKSCDESLQVICQISMGVPFSGSGPFTTVAQREGLVCQDSSWLLYQGRCYMVVNTHLNIYLADSACRNRSMTLVSIHSQEENTAVEDYIIRQSGQKPFMDLWIGLTGMSLGGQPSFFWRDGTDVDFIKPVLSIHYSPVYCVALIIGVGEWFGDDCSVAKPFICMGNADTVPSTTSTTAVPSTTTTPPATKTKLTASSSTWSPSSTADKTTVRPKTAGPQYFTYKIPPIHDNVGLRPLVEMDNSLTAGEVAALVFGILAGLFILGVLVYTIHSVLERRKTYGVEKASLGFDNALFHKNNESVTIDE